MKIIKKLSITTLFLVLTYSNTFAQLDSLKRVDSTLKTKNLFNKKWYVGFNYLQTWTSISGSHETGYFYKPSIGILISYDYFFKHDFGIYAGLAYQQRGTGIKSPDYTSGLGDTDSTYLERLRFNCIDLHLGVNFRSKKDIFERVRATYSLGAVVIYNYLCDDINLSVNDGYHQFTDVTNTYNRFDVALEGAIGLDINVANSTILRVQAITNFGLTNVNGDTKGSPKLSGQNRLFGLKVGWLF